MNANKLSMIWKDCDEATSGSIHLLSKLKEECILITGGTGFMGTWLAEMVTFLNDDHAFNSKLILLSESSQNFIEKAPHLAMRDDVELIECDIRNVMEISNKVSYIIHAAANPDNRVHASNPIRTMYVIANGTDAILKASLRLSNLKNFLNISSGLIYGSQPLEMNAIAEKYQGGSDCSSVASAYVESKRFAETLCSAYRSQYKVPIVTARPFAFIGPYQLLDKPWAINNFIRDSLMGGPIRILGDGETVRSYMYPSDMAFWLLRILIDGTSGLAYNVGSPHGITLQQLAEEISNNSTVKSEISSHAADEGKSYQSRLVPDVTLAENNLGLSMKVDIAEAIKRTLLWFK